MRKHIRYPEEYKAQIVKRILHDGIPMSIVCREENLDVSNVRNWVAKHAAMNPPETPDAEKQASMSAHDWKHEYERLQKAHQRTLLELEIVKKAVGIISRMP
ncbi:MAG: Transposase [Chloroflexota bacterium]|jgi:transposase-like protein